VTGRYERYETAFGDRDAPFAFVDLDALDANGRDLLEAAGGKPIRVATKSVRCRALTAQILASDPGFKGVMTFTLRETLWLGIADALLAYPTTDREALRQLATREPQPAIVVDSTDHLDLIDAAVGAVRPPTRVVIEIDLAYMLPGGTKIGAKRSPLRTPEEVAGLARAIRARKGFELVGVMGYEAHVAGVGDRPRGKPLYGAAIRTLQKLSTKEIARRRKAIDDAVGDLEIVNGGGTGNLAASAAEPAVTEVTAGSGF
jgi:D-serine deaminase-like pyridoxal phosphate-dependent protein